LLIPNPNSAQYINLSDEMEKRVFANRAEYLGNLDFVDIHIKTPLSDEYISKRATEVNLTAI
jgi:gamma-glutamyltranspeptidase/glutathione hydrolase